MTAAQTYTCIVCKETEERESLLEYCNGCQELFHYNRSNQPGKDCGDAWIDDEEEGMNFFCRTCMEQAKSEDQDRMREFATAAMQGTVSAEQMADMMRAFAAGSAGSQFAGMKLQDLPMPNIPANPWMPSIPGVPAAGIPGAGPVSAADLFARFGMTPPDGVQFGGSESAPATEAASSPPPAAKPASPRSGDGPPLLRERRSGPRRYRRID